MSAAVLAAMLLVIAVVAYAAARAGRADGELDRKRLEAMDERRAAANLYAHERRLEVAPQRPPER